MNARSFTTSSSMRIVAFKSARSTISHFHLIGRHCSPVKTTSRKLIIQANSSKTTKRTENESIKSSVTSAAQAVELGLQKFQTGDAETALQLFLRAQQLSPSEDELCAALYNSACAYTKLQRWQEAADAVVDTVNNHNLKLVVALRDPDLAPLRERREWTSALSQASGGITNESYVKLKTEAKAPFRLTRIILFGGLAAGAGLGLLIITARLIAALQGGEGAPDIQETAQNFAINSAAVAILTFLVVRDLKSQSRDQEIVNREESLATLQVSLGKNRVVPLAAFRGSTRPVIITGSKAHVNKAVAAAEPYKQELRLRGISLVPIVLSEDDYNDTLRRLKEEMMKDGNSNASMISSSSSGRKKSSASTGFASSSSSSSSGASKETKKISKEETPVPTTDENGFVDKADRRWKLEAVETSEWQEWINDQTKSAGLKSADANVYIQVQLDGTVRASGVGIPPWRQFLDDVPELDSVRTKFGDGRGM